MSDIEPFKTSDTSLAAYLHFMGMKALAMRIDPNDTKRLIFVFLDEPERPEYERDFLYGDAKQFLRYYRCLRDMNGLIAEKRREQYGDR
jgi:hypothetical protein